MREGRGVYIKKRNKEKKRTKRKKEKKERKRLGRLLSDIYNTLKLGS